MNGVTTIATIVIAMTAVASQPIAWSRGGKVKSPMMSLRIEKIIIIAIIGAAATPFTTALQNSALIGSA
jgi:hypothetical protein